MMNLRVIGSVVLLLLWSATARAEALHKHPKTFKVGPNPNSIAAADLNGDDIPDIVTANTGAMSDPKQERPANDECSILESSAALEYTALPPLRTDFAPYAVALGNVDALKAPDIIVASFMAVHHRDLTLFRNMGEDVYESSTYRVTDETLSYNRMNDGDNEPVFEKPGLTSLALVDVNHDGYRDVIATAWCSDVLVQFPGTANTFFGEPRFLKSPGGPRDVKAADLDGDGNLDLAVALYASNEVGLWKGDGKGGFTALTRFSSRGKLPSKVQVSDINGDGKQDIVVSHCHTDDSIMIFYGDSELSFSVSQEICLGKDRDILEHEIRDICTGDFNGDGRIDIAAACYGSGQVVVLLNDSAGAAVPVRLKQESYSFENGKPRALCVADFNRDGATDIAAALWGSNSVCILSGSKTAKEKEDTHREEEKAAKPKKSPKKGAS